MRHRKDFVEWLWRKVELATIMVALAWTWISTGRATDESPVWRRRILR